MAGPRSDGWMPDLCRLPRLAMMFAVAELVVLVLVLSPDDETRANLGRFASASGFALWLALTIAALLCASRRWLSRRGASWSCHPRRRPRLRPFHRCWR